MFGKILDMLWSIVMLISIVVSTNNGDMELYKNTIGLMIWYFGMRYIINTWEM